jgi:hypothetical protein
MTSGPLMQTRALTKSFARESVKFTQTQEPISSKVPLGWLWWT